MPITKYSACCVPYSHETERARQTLSKIEKECLRDRPLPLSKPSHSEREDESTLPSIWKAGCLSVLLYVFLPLPIFFKGKFSFTSWFILPLALSAARVTKRVLRHSTVSKTCMPKKLSCSFVSCVIGKTIAHYSSMSTPQNNETLNNMARQALTLNGVFVSVRLQPSWLQRKQCCNAEIRKGVHGAL